MRTKTQITQALTALWRDVEHCGDDMTAMQAQEYAAAIEVLQWVLDQPCSFADPLFGHLLGESNDEVDSGGDASAN